MTKDERLRVLADQIREMVAVAASEAGGLSEEEADRWWDEIQDRVTEAFESVAP